MTKKMNGIKRTDIFSDILNLFISGCFFAVAYNMFLVPGGIFIGGAGGIATAIHILNENIPTGAMIFCINVPLLLLFIYFYGFRSSLKALIGIAVSSAFVDVTAMFNFLIPAFGPEDHILNAIFGGGVLGIAVAFMFKRGYTTGGSDLAALLLKLKFKGLPTPKVILAVDACVVLFAAWVTKSEYHSVLYSFLAIFMCSSALEFVNGGFEKTRLAYIFSEKYAEVADALMMKVNRGVTLLDGMGWYTKSDKKIVLCVVKKNELFELKSAVREVDPNAFMILGEATETIGEGFKEVLGDIAIEPKKRGKKK